MQQFLIEAPDGKVTEYLEREVLREFRKAYGEVLVVELKYAQTAASAIQQIKDRQYAEALEKYTGEILLVGIDYDRKMANRPHSCVIERRRKVKVNDLKKL